MITFANWKLKTKDMTKVTIIKKYRNLKTINVLEFSEVVCLE